MAEKRVRQLGRFWLSLRNDRTSYYICWNDGSRHVRRISTGTSDFSEAESLLAEHYQKHELLHQEQPTDVPLMTILDRYYDKHAKNLPSAKSAKSAIELLRRHCAAVSVASFSKKKQLETFDAILYEPREDTRGRKERARRDASHKRTHGYVSRIMSVARAALNRALDLEELVSVPRFMKLPRGGSRDRVLEPDEVAALFNAAQGDAQYLYLLLAFATGARPTAIIELTRSQINFRRQLVTLNPSGRRQTKKHRPILPLAKAVMPWLEEGDSEYFINYDGKPYTKAGFDAILKRLIKRSGLEGVSPYTIRHTVATELTARGVDFANVRLFLGHSMQSLGVTGGYIHFRPDFLLSARDAIDQFFAELSPLLNRPIVRVLLEEQPLPSALHAQCTPRIEELHDAVDANVLNELVGVTRFVVYRESRWMRASSSATETDVSTEKAVKLH